MRMSWDKLLHPTRIRDLARGTTKLTRDHRSEYQQDFDRVVFSSPVRRLQDKAQVFPLEPNDAVRTRLTHSLEVSTVGRGIVLKIAQHLGSDHPFSQRERDIHDVAVTAGLIHDLGNPPFGHFGEDAIREWFAKPNGPGAVALKPLRGHKQMTADILVHEGNARTIRLLCSLQVLADRYGLNPTAATVAAAMKYVAPSHKAGTPKNNHSRSKPGFLWWDQPIVDRVREVTGIGEMRHPIAFIVEAADDCVYSLCDLEDAVRKGILSWDELCTVLCEQVEGQAEKAAFQKELKVVADEVDKRFDGSDLKPGLRARDDARAQWLRVKGQGVVVYEAAASFVARYAEIMRGRFAGELVMDAQFAPNAQRMVRSCKKAARKYVYPVRPNLELELRGREVIHDLMDLLWEGVRAFDGEGPPSRTAAGKAWNLLSENYRTLFEADWRSVEQTAKTRGVPQRVVKQYLRLLLLTDYIGGMTDTFACTLHRSLTNG
jgi:dGTPase